MAEPNGSTQVTGDQAPSPDIMVSQILGKPLKVNGRDKDLSLKDALNELQKELAAQEKWDKAQETESNAKAAIDTYNALKAGVKDVAALRVALRTAGWPEETIQAATQAGSRASPEDLDTGDEEDPLADILEDDTAPPRRPAKRFNGRPQVDPELQALLPQLKEMANSYKQAQFEQQRRSYQAQVDQAIDSDSELAKMMEGKTPRAQQLLRERAYNAVGRRAAEGHPWGPRVISSGLDTLKDELKELGISASSKPNPPANPDFDSLIDHRSLAAAGIGPDKQELHRILSEEPKGDIPHMNDPEYSRGFFRDLLKYAAGPGRQRKG